MNGLFGQPEGAELKGKGLRRAVKAKQGLLEDARQIARWIALQRETRELTADAVRYVMEKQNMGDLGPAAGALFNTSDWQFTGRYVKSKHPANHARELKLWRYVGEGA